MVAARVTANDYAQRELGLMRAIATIGERNPRREELVDELWALRHAVTHPRCRACGHRLDSTESDEGAFQSQSRLAAS